MYETSFELLSTACSFHRTRMEFLQTHLFSRHSSRSSSPNLSSGQDQLWRWIQLWCWTKVPSSISKAGDTTPLWATNTWQSFRQRHFNYHIIHSKAKGAKDGSGTKFRVYTPKTRLAMWVSIQPGSSQRAGKQLGLSKSEKPDFPISYHSC